MCGHFQSNRYQLAALAVALLIPLDGCGKKTDSSPTTTNASDTKSNVPAEALPASTSLEPSAYEADGEQLLAARLLPSQSANGWIRLFDGHTLFGWEITGKANWRVENGAIVVDSGDKCFLCTSSIWKDFELTLEFNADEKTNSGVFVRTQLDPLDVETECYEINIAPDDNPFPTASVVKRQKVSKNAPEQTFSKWRRMTIRVDGQKVDVKVDGKLACEYTDPVVLAANRISLQHNTGRVAFRDVRIRPLNLDTLLDKKLSKWTKYPKMPGEFSTTDDGSLQVKGGRTQLESKESYDDFILLAEYKMGSEEMNSGIFFRCIPGDEMMGYECQVSNQRKDGNPLAPADHGTGGIFKRQEARVVAGDPGKWATVLLNVHGPNIAAWVNGVQVSNWQDDRKPNENPRRGLRLEAGTLMIQGHDPGTDALFRQLKITGTK